MRVISFDVFDTVLTRAWAEPHDVFLQVGERLLATHPGGIAAPAFAVARRQAEQEARRRAPKGEVVLDDIFAVLAAQLGWDAVRRDAAKAVELAVETEGIRPVPGMPAEVNQARRETGSIVFVSDMYLPSVTVQSWLEQAGCWQPGDRLFISGEAGVGKGTGEMFEKIRTDLGADFKNWVHHGDHPVSDLAQPERFGVAVRHWPAARLARREGFLRGRNPVVPGWRSLLAGAGRLARLDRPAEADETHQRVLWETGATLAGPLFHGFTDWCLAEAERRGIEDLFFLARAGQLFLRQAREIQAARPREVRLHYLPVSRLAFIGIADRARPERLRALAAPRHGFLSARQACAHLGLSTEAWPAPPWLPPAEWARNLTPSEREKLADWLLDPVRLPGVEAALHERRGRARDWLLQQGLSANGRFGVVDTGWTGTIQHSIEIALGVDNAPVPVTGFYLGLNQQSDFACTGPMLAYGDTFSRTPVQRVQTLRVLVELMARADHGAVVGYAGEGPGSMTARFGPVEAATVQQIRFFQESVLAFTRRALAAGPELALVPPVEFARVVGNAYVEFHQHPTQAEVLVFGRIPHSDQMLEQDYAVLCPALRPGEVLAALLSRRRRPVCWWLPGQATLGLAPLLYFYMGLTRTKWWVQSAFKKVA